MKVFISSVITGYEAFRDAARQAVETLGHQVIRAEDFGASTSSPRVACLSGVRASDLVILLMGRRYGMLQQSGLSATHEEFREARDRKEIVAFVENVQDREAEQREFLNEVQDWQGGLFTEAFDTPESLRRVVTKMLHDRLIEQARGTPDQEELRQRVTALVPRPQRGISNYRTELAIALAGAPRQTLLRPIEIEGKDLDQKTFALALQGQHAVFDRSERTSSEVRDNCFVLNQESRSVAIHADGSLLLVTPIASESLMGAIVEEAVQESIERALGFFSDLLSNLDPTERLRHLCVSTNILGAEYAGWRTRAEDKSSPNSMSMGHAQDPEPITTGILPRAALRTQRRQSAEDLTVLLRRKYR